MMIRSVVWFQTEVCDRQDNDVYAGRETLGPGIQTGDHTNGSHRQQSSAKTLIAL